MENTLIQPAPDRGKKAFWDQHLEMQHASGLSRAKYCKENSLNYWNFCYWFNKKTDQASSLVAVKIKSPPSASETLCQLHFPNGCRLAIQDFKALSFILSEMR
jgi:hypothetical protein